MPLLQTYIFLINPSICELFPVSSTPCFESDKEELKTMEVQRMVDNLCDSARIKHEFLSTSLELFNKTPNFGIEMTKKEKEAIFKL